MNQAIATGQDVDKGTELGDVDNLALIDLANLSGWGIEDQPNLTLGLLDLVAIG